MTQQELNLLSYDEVMQIEGICASNETMTLKEYAEGGYFDTYYVRTDDFEFKTGGYITIIPDDENEEFGLKAVFVDEDDVKSDFNLMF